MIHLSDLAQVTLDQPSIVTIGVFDGVHRGHQALLKQLVEQAQASNRLSVALTFHPHPDVYFGKVSGRYYLTTPEERARLIGALGVDYVITLPFDDALRIVRAADFVGRLRDHLKLEWLWIGTDFALGYQREGTPELLRTLGDEIGFSVRAIALIEGGGAAISSTQIRSALALGDVEAAAGLLGRPYSVRGLVVHGEARGRSIGFPTANIDIWREQIIPANGVYAGWAILGEGEQAERYMAVTNVGLRPTFDGQGVTVETHLLDFDRDIYGQSLAFTFEKRLRAEQKFNGIGELIAQIGLDSAAGRDFLMAQPAPLP